MQAKGRQRVKSCPPQQCALCSTWKTIATRSCRGNDKWGKYVALQPEETMSKKKNRHEVTDLIKGEKYTESREMGNTTGGEGALGEGSGHWGGGLLLRWRKPEAETGVALPRGSTEALLQQTWNPGTRRSGPQPCCTSMRSSETDIYTLSRGTPRCLSTDRRRQKGGSGWWNKAIQKEEYHWNPALRPWAGVLIMFHSYLPSTSCVISGNITVCDVALM